ncbi:MAG: DUF58 domain-containing protein [Planctomycetes bacterium]|nr:DUF58 domain-containing protein [Planctomycetota bacterium]
MEDYRRYLNPQVLNKISRLDLKARLVVEGYIAGLHRSPYRGVSQEFAAHREYVPGDDLRHLDWKVFGRSDRLYVKQYEQETNLICYLLLDVSESMSYGSTTVNKLEYSRYLAAALSFLMVQQQDAVGLVLFDRQVRKTIPARSSTPHLNLILKELSEAQPTLKTDFKAISDDVTTHLAQKGLVIVISDLFDEPERILSGLERIRAKGQEVIVFNILDEYEVRFPFERMTRFEGMEEYPQLFADPRTLRNEYLKTLEDFLSRIRRGCLAERIDYVRISTDQMLDVALTAYLAKRERL